MRNRKTASSFGGKKITNVMLSSSPFALWVWSLFTMKKTIRIIYLWAFSLIRWCIRLNIVWRWFLSKCVTGFRKTYVKFGLLFFFVMVWIKAIYMVSTTKNVIRFLSTRLVCWTVIYWIVRWVGLRKFIAVLTMRSTLILLLKVVKT